MGKNDKNKEDFNGLKGIAKLLPTLEINWYKKIRESRCDIGKQISMIFIDKVKIN
ncbi:hypothetical protein [Peribacillus phoenicis]|uniref:hypothetical protein n=1 Tax=Peribacillus sp. 1P06PA-2 TaxID=3132295 RepID=UPI0039A6FD57